MKKLLALSLALVICVSALATGAFAADVSANVYVTICDAGEIAVAAAPVAVSNADGDGALTVNDALLAAHAEFYPDGVSGYESYEGDYGLALKKLWGVDNGGSYGYCVNNVSSMSLADPVEDGDYVCAYAYSDLETWSDKYSYFDSSLATVSTDGELSLALTANGFDADWNPVVTPVADAVITIDGEKTEYVADKDGRAALSFAEAGVYTVSAVSETETLVPPVCVVTVLAPEDMPMTRADVVSLLYLSENAPSVKTAAPFPDVAKDAEYADAVAWAAESKIVSGYGNGDFAPDDYVTLAQLCVIFRGYCEYTGGDVTTSADISGLVNVPDWAEASASWALAESFIENGSDLGSTVSTSALRTMINAAMSAE